MVIVRGMVLTYMSSGFRGTVSLSTKKNTRALLARFSGTDWYTPLPTSASLSVQNRCSVLPSGYSLFCCMFNYGTKTIRRGSPMGALKVVVGDAGTIVSWVIGFLLTGVVLHYNQRRFRHAVVRASHSDLDRLAT